ncbi:hypothetical protein G7Z17_g13540 [Cylindrodendrum hubeiense]|uniref:Uncharacterized protein n=1 Tax=Cylindrodendrum hubeiense TaxID=595255 RepID=A0A9P5L269_9HYPO|nr:hypothetical protein G7Z17_g13540 [Cylindrodendrum hubeiense]
MTSPISIGDAYLLAKLALKLGHAFTKGRKSAPAEFREVENQLYSLSAALSALKDVRTPSQDKEVGRDILHSQTDRIECRVKEVADMLKEIHVWFNDNLKHNRVSVQPAADGRAGDVAEPALPALTFELYLQSKDTPRMICQTASLAPRWDENHVPHETISSFFLVTVEFPRASEFEETFIWSLGLSRARALLHQNIDTMMVYEAPVDQIESTPEARILNLMGQAYTRNSIETVQLLHYKALEKRLLGGYPAAIGHQTSHCDNAEIVVFYGQEDSRDDDADIDRTVVYSCARFRSKVEEMRLELFAMSLESPQSHETLALKLQATGVCTEEWNLADSELSILASSTTGRLRLLVKSQDGRWQKTSSLAKAAAKTSDA